jgi:hypothetical protein
MLAEETILSEPSWEMQSDSVRIAVTHLGAHMAPVHFSLPQKLPLQPYYISPWQCEEHSYLDGSSEGILRGDFFCLPFGKADSADGTPSHGRTSSARWSLRGHRSHAGVQEIGIQMENALHNACVTREFYLRDGETVIYDRTTISGLDGYYTMGHHATLRTPSQESGLLVSTSRIGFGMTFPGHFGNPANAEYQSLAMGAEFTTLNSVPSIFREFPNADCSRFPARRGFTDLLQVAVEADTGQPAWSAAVNSEEGYLWFSLRDPALLPSTILWIENGGRHRPPWSGRNCSLGIEDVCSYFDSGSASSAAANAFSQRGFKTIQQFVPEQPLSIPYIQGVVSTPPGFSHVRTVRCGSYGATFADAAGREVTSHLCADFVFGEKL